MALVFIVEDDNDIRQIEAYALKCGGFEIEEFEDAKALYERLEKKTPDLFLLDVMLPDEDGLEIVKKLRAMPQTKHLPVMMVTAKTTELDKVRGLDIGADDYMTKPFNILEVKARIKSILRRTGSAPETPKLELTARDITINIGNRSVTAHGEPVNLTVKEFDLLQLFMNNPGRVYSRDELLETIWGFDYLGDVRTVDVHIRRLREKIEIDSTKPSYIMTKWGVGYYFAKE